MGGFRDDREALRARIEALEAELRSGGPDREEVLAQLRQLTQQVTATRERVETDREDLADLAERIDALRRDLKGPSEGPWPDGEDEAAHAASDRDAQRMRSRLGMGCVTVLLIGSCAVWLLARDTQRKVEVTASTAPRALVSASQLPGGEHAVDPMAVLERARRYAPADAELSSMELAYVSSDGTLDLDHPAYRATAEYRFEGLRPGTGPSSAPLGAPQPRPAVRSSLYRVDRDGLHGDSTAMLGDLVPLPSRGVAGDPQCTPAQVWEAAIGAGAPRDAVAQLRYGLQPAPLAGPSLRLPTWHFRIVGTDVSMYVKDADCRVMGQGREDPRYESDAGSSSDAAAASR